MGKLWKTHYFYDYVKFHLILFLSIFFILDTKNRFAPFRSLLFTHTLQEPTVLCLPKRWSASLERRPRWIFQLGDIGNHSMTDSPKMEQFSHNPIYIHIHPFTYGWWHQFTCWDYVWRILDSKNDMPFACVARRRVPAAPLRCSIGSLRESLWDTYPYGKGKNNCFFYVFL